MSFVLAGGNGLSILSAAGPDAVWTVRTTVCGPVQAPFFDREGQPVLVLWTPAPEGKIRVGIKTTARKIGLRTVADATSEEAVTDATLSLAVTHAPVFISGCADSIRFGSEFSYRFDLGHARSARLNMNVGANGANAWSLLVSKDDKVYVTEASGKCWPAWQSVALDKYLAEQGEAPRTIFVKVQGTDCQVREVVLESGGR